MTKYEIHNLAYLKQNRQKLRKNQTSAENLLWQYLRGQQLEGRKFRRQHSIENYIADFYCATEKLIIELDGTHHAEGETFENDQIRDARLAQLNYNVLRFSNAEIFANIHTVLTRISENFQNQQAA